MRYFETFRVTISFKREIEFDVGFPVISSKNGLPSNNDITNNTVIKNFIVQYTVKCDQYAQSHMFILNKQRMSETLLRQNEQWKQLRLILAQLRRVLQAAISPTIPHEG